MKKLSLTFILWLLILSSPVVSLSAHSNSLNIAIMTVDPAYIEVFDKFFTDFDAQHPDISVTVDYYSDARYKRDINHWMENGSYDVLYWQGGERLVSLIEKQLLVPIDTLISKAHIENAYQANVLERVTQDNFVYALPMAQYSWGFYYNKAIFTQLSLSPPKTWPEFINVMLELKANDISPFIQPVDDSWPVGAWIDLLTLAAGSQPLHSNWVSDTPSNDPKDIEPLLNRANQVLGHDYFYAQGHAWKWTEGIPNVLRGQAAMVLLGQFAEGRIPASFSDRIGYFPLPLSPNIQISALELWVVPRITQKSPALVKLLEMLSDPEKSAQLAVSLDWLPVSNINTKTLPLSQREFTALNALTSATNHVSYFDRDVSRYYASAFESALIASIQQDDSSPLASFLSYPKPHQEELPPPQQNTITLGALSGVTGTHLVVKLFRQLYENIGYELDVNYVENEQALTRAYAQGLDGEFLRQSGYDEQYPDLIRLSESIGKGTFYLVCKTDDICSNDTARSEQKFATSINSAVGDWWENENQTELLHYSSSFAMWRDLFDGKVDGVFSPEFDILSQSNNLQNYKIVPVIEIELYHYIHKRHSDLVPLLDAELKRIKVEGTWDAILEQYRAEQ